MSYDGFFELLYNGKNILQTESNNPEDMGTFNYYSPTSETDGHRIYDVEPYGYFNGNKYGNVPK